MDGTAGTGSSVAGESTVIDLHGFCRPVVEGTAVPAGQVVCECTVADIGVCFCTIVADGTTAAGVAGIACRLGSAGFVLRESTVLNIQRIAAVTDGTAAACRIVVDEYDIPDCQHGIVVGIDGAAVSGSIAVLKLHTCQCHIHIFAGDRQETGPVGAVSDFACGRIGGDCVAAVQRDFARTVNGQGDGRGRGDGDLAAHCDGRDAVRKGDHAAGTVIGIHKPVDCVRDCFPQRDHAVEGIEDIVRGIHGQGRCFQCVKRVGPGVEGECRQNAAHCIPVGVFVLRCGEDFAPGQTVCCGIGGIEVISRCRCIRCVDPFAVAEVVIHAVKFPDQGTAACGFTGIQERQSAACVERRCCAEFRFNGGCHITGIQSHAVRQADGILINVVECVELCGCFAFRHLPDVIHRRCTVSCRSAEDDVVQERYGWRTNAAVGDVYPEHRECIAGSGVSRIDKCVVDDVVR